ncbi:pantoate--beta-alanine ligase [Leucobacter sp. CSA1]|uniref:Pantothenate synthetase n=1 Tax=Leucobacter chromiisoli TaxID=2796471 RepID=A0A934Q7W6_9MICO|nr:pantoate--beta-alanine ligase [Leucobacter chromiisoli]MBK0419895.1 pantoate--beta-alanine ligase [Leucobacter chromiisoli]
MRTVRTIRELREALRPARAGTIGFVPTMGALHEGHLSLVRAARRANDTVVLSIFVNPTQFTEAADLEAYPRDQARDLRLAEEAGVDVVFAPDAEEMYPAGFATVVSVGGSITETLEAEGRGRGHFDGMATVVAKLLLAVLPDKAYFGAKDAQQAVVVRRLVADLNIPVAIDVCETSREADGLARSSRNVRLGPDERRRAAAIPQALRLVERLAREGETRPAELRTAASRILRENGIEEEYLAFVDPDTLERVPAVDRPTLVAVAARVGGVRLIDNVRLAQGEADR